MNALSRRFRDAHPACRRRWQRLAALALAMLIGTGAMRPAETAPPEGSDSSAILQFLNQTIRWYRQIDSLRQLATDPDELVILNENQQLANEAVSLAFDFARARAESLEKQPASSQPDADNPDSSRYQALQRMSTTLDRQIRETQLELESLRQKLLSSQESQRQKLQAQIAEVQSELDLATARRDSLHSMADFMSGSSINGLGATDLREQIEALARTVPAAIIKPSTKQQPAAAEQLHTAPAAAAPKSEPAGVWGLAADLFSLSGKMRTLGGNIDDTDTLNRQTSELRTPLVRQLRDLSKQGDQLANQADSAGQAQLAQEKKQLDALTKQFKAASAVVLPLSKQGILFEQYKRNLTEWRDTLRGRYRSELSGLLFRIVALIFFLAATITAAELWRRTIFRYVQDARRRYQYLLLRKIVLWFTIAVILIFSFATEISSAATFAGLLTAGVAVALQNVILSVAGYFFLIGKFGIRVGDRVQVAGVTGEVVDVGLVRFHMLELIGGGAKTPSGRVVAFSNSIVFQSNAGLFKQIPGTSFVWHEVTVSVPSGSDHASVEKRLRETVEAVFSDYRDEMERQYRQVDRTVAAIPKGTLQPKARLHLAESGLEVVIRYPVDLMHAAEIDDRVTRELLKAAGPGSPNIKLRTDLSSSH